MCARPRVSCSQQISEQDLPAEHLAFEGACQTMLLYTRLYTYEFYYYYYYFFILYVFPPSLFTGSYRPTGATRDRHLCLACGQKRIGEPLLIYGSARRKRVRRRPSLPHYRIVIRVNNAYEYKRYRFTVRYCPSIRADARFY